MLRNFINLQKTFEFNCNSFHEKKKDFGIDQCNLNQSRLQVKNKPTNKNAEVQGTPKFIAIKCMFTTKVDEIFNRRYGVGVKMCYPSGLTTNTQIVPSFGLITNFQILTSLEKGGVCLF